MKYQAGRLVSTLLGRFGLVVLDYGYPDRKSIIKRAKKISKEVDFGLSYAEAHQLVMAVKATAFIKGEIAEVGVYQGGSAKLICEEKDERKLYLFDTFEGFPTVGFMDATFLEEGQCRAEYLKVKEYLRKYKDVSIYEGLFPKTAAPVEDENFSFVHIDVDLYKSTLDCLMFFYPRLNPGGILLSHDYKTLPGVKQAFDEYFRGRPVPVIELPTSQCLVVKV